ncbi:hypothetical protein [Streptodolium elevatio]|uniref:DUF1330 domain-containing protein n=1 Tax=Streptodolium elevatio TaxID=3157996 RepID=A0ABV3DBS6_9ACTN
MTPKHGDLVLVAMGVDDTELARYSQYAPEFEPCLEWFGTDYASRVEHYPIVAIVEVVPRD